MHVEYRVDVKFWVLKKELKNEMNFLSYDDVFQG